MVQDVYADLLFLINFSMDYICLYATARFLGKGIKFRRFLLAAAIGGLYSVLSLFFPFSTQVNMVIDTTFGLVICAVAFAERGRKFTSVLLYGFLFVGISMMMGGIMTAIFNALNRLDLPLDAIGGDGISTYLFAIIATVAGMITLGNGKIVSKKSNVRECKINLSVLGNQGEFLALADSGNLVKDPLSGKSIVLVDRDTLARLTDVQMFDDFLKGDVATTAMPPLGFRIVPINTAGGHSLLCAIQPDKMTAEIVTQSNKTVTLDLDALIAPADIGKSAEGYGGIVPTSILKL